MRHCRITSQITIPQCSSSRNTWIEKQFCLYNILNGHTFSQPHDQKEWFCQAFTTKKYENSRQKCQSGKSSELVGNS